MTNSQRRAGFFNIRAKYHNTPCSAHAPHDAHLLMLCKLVLQGPEPAHSAVLADYVRYNIGHLLKPQHSKPAEESFEEASPSDIHTEAPEDDHVKASPFPLQLLLHLAVHTRLCFC